MMGNEGIAVLTFLVLTATAMCALWWLRLFMDVVVFIADILYGISCTVIGYLRGRDFPHEVDAVSDSIVGAEKGKEG